MFDFGSELHSRPKSMRSFWVPHTSSENVIALPIGVWNTAWVSFKILSNKGGKSGGGENCTAKLSLKPQIAPIRYSTTIRDIEKAVWAMVIGVSG